MEPNTHGDWSNLFYIDKTGKKIFIKIILKLMKNNCLVSACILPIIRKGLLLKQLKAY
ncbi:MAG: hypothetical protein IPP43_03455 [Chitinophagaceae bacterium]|nr:hypothetical protein [Chitinophagaceae bacterium]